MSPFPDARLRRAGANRAQIKAVMEHYSGLGEEARAEFEYEVAAVNDARLAELVADLDERTGPAYEPATEPAGEPGGQPASAPGGEPSVPGQQPAAEPGGEPAGRADHSSDGGTGDPETDGSEPDDADGDGEHPVRVQPSFDNGPVADLTPEQWAAQEEEKARQEASAAAHDAVNEKPLDDETATAALETAKTVEAHIAEHPEHAADLAEREKAGRARKTVLALLDKAAAPAPQE